MSFSTTTIRPLGEEHLRMFRRMVGTHDHASKVAIPEEARGYALFMSQKELLRTEAEELARRQAGRLATLMEVATDKRFINRHALERGVGWFFIDWRDAPTDRGWYRLDRARRKLTFLCKFIHGTNALKAIDPMERLYVYRDVADSVKAKKPLALLFRTAGLRLGGSGAVCALTSEAHAAMVIPKGGR